MPSGWRSLFFGVANGVGDSSRSFLEFTRQNRDKHISAARVADLGERLGGNESHCA
jgi:hypothetical protein